LCLKHYSIRTEEAYVDWIKRFILGGAFAGEANDNVGGDAGTPQLRVNPVDMAQG
jgi:hypothetical protein